MRNEEECVCSAPSCCDTEQRSASQPACILPDAPLCLSVIWLRVPGLVGSGTPCTRHIIAKFYVFLTVHLRIILVSNQLDAQFLT